jgi:hydroxymethylpyrimidine kinase/phosphomethylpyrimidine kinase
MRATSGDELIEDDADSCLVSDLFPLAKLVTPNIPEAERLTGMTINDEQTMRAAAQRSREVGARAVLVKGGHLFSRRKHHSANSERREAIDVLDNDGEVTVLRGELISGGEVHGSGCTLSAAIAASLAHGKTLVEAVRAAKEFVTAAIKGAPAVGHGARPLFF